MPRVYLYKAYSSLFLGNDCFHYTHELRQRYSLHRTYKYKSTDGQSTIGQITLHPRVNTKVSPLSLQPKKIQDTDTRYE